MTYPLEFIDENRYRRVAAGKAPKTVYNETKIIRLEIGVQSGPTSGE